MGSRRRARRDSGGWVGWRAGWRRCRPPDEPGSRAPSSDGESSRASGPAARAQRRDGRAHATEEQLARIHAEPYLALLRAVNRPGAPRCGHGLLGDVVGSGDARGGDHARGGRPRRLRARAAARPPRAGRPCDGLLPRQQRRGRGALRAAGARPRARGDRRLRRAPRQRHRGELPRRRLRPLRLAAPVAVLSGHGRPGHERRDDAQPAASRPAPATRSTARHSRPRSSRPCAGSRRTSCSSRPASTPTRRIRWRRWR